MTNQQPNQHLPPLQPPQKPIPPSKEEMARDLYRANLRHTKLAAGSLLSIIEQLENTSDKLQMKDQVSKVVASADKLLDAMEREDDQKLLEKHRKSQADFAALQAESAKQVKSFEEEMKRIAREAVKEEMRDRTK